MTTVLPERPVVSVPSPTPPLMHPTACPSWCKDRGNSAAHHFGPSSTAHWSPQYVLPNPRPLPGADSPLLRAELSRVDEGDRLDRTVLFVQGETDIDLSPDEADIFIAQAQAWVDTLRVLRRQMGNEQRETSPITLVTKGAEG